MRESEERVGKWIRQKGVKKILLVRITLVKVTKSIPVLESIKVAQFLIILPMRRQSLFEQRVRKPARVSSWRHEKSTNVEKS